MQKYLTFIKFFPFIVGTFKMVLYSKLCIMFLNRE